MAVELRIVVSVKEGVIRSDVSCWARIEVGLMTVETNVGIVGADG